VDIEKKMAALDRVYMIYDGFMASLDLACRERCAHCCTANVTLTTLEGYRILNELDSDGKKDIVDKVHSAIHKNRFQPKLTTNQFADLCARGLEPPDEEAPPVDEVCSLLLDDLCPIYSARPFGCRCLVSRHDCGERGYAEIDDFVLSVNTVFLQMIEHIDVGGCTGNLLDVLCGLSEEENRRSCEGNSLSCSDVGLIPNQPLKVLMIPPEHRARIEPILRELRQSTIFSSNSPNI
jgi:hypothetical protein